MASEDLLTHPALAAIQTASYALATADATTVPLDDARVIVRELPLLAQRLLALAAAIEPQFQSDSLDMGEHAALHAIMTGLNLATAPMGGIAPDERGGDDDGGERDPSLTTHAEVHAAAAGTLDRAADQLAAPWREGAGATWGRRVAFYDAGSLTRHDQAALKRAAP